MNMQQEQMRADATPYGALLKAAGFSLVTTGGGCMAFEKELSSGNMIRVTDSEGLAWDHSDEFPGMLLCLYGHEYQNPGGGDRDCICCIETADSSPEPLQHAIRRLERIVE